MYVLKMIKNLIFFLRFLVIGKYEVRFDQTGCQLVKSLNLKCLVRVEVADNLYRFFLILLRVIFTVQVIVRVSVGEVEVIILWYVRFGYFYESKLFFFSSVFYLYRYSVFKLGRFSFCDSCV